MVVQLVKASIKPDQRDRWLQAIRWNAEQTRAEDGCQGYQVAEDLEAPNNFMIVELWADLETVYTHFRNQFEELMAKLDGVFAAPPEAWIHEVAATLTLDEALAAAGLSR